MRAPNHIVIDLGMKVRGDVKDALERTVSLVDHPGDRAAISLIAASIAIGFALRFLKQTMPPDAETEHVLDHLWQDRLRGMILMALEASNARGDQ